MSNSTKKNIGVFIKETDFDQKRLDYYEEKMKKKEILEKQFSMADISGNLYVFEGGVKVQLDNFEISGALGKRHGRNMALRNTYPVVVASVNREKKEVHLSHNEAKAVTKEELTAMLDEAIDKGEPMTVMARVERIKGNAGSSYVVIDIEGVGLTGVIRMRDWSTVFTSDIRLVAKPGDIIKVVVKRHCLWNGNPAYSCSRGEALDFDPWSGIEDKLPAKTTVNVTCICKTPKNFFGKIDGIEEINAYCEYPDPEKNIEIKEGITYQGYVSAVSEEKKLLRVRITNQLK